jgi:hypothetical protein
MVNRVPRSAMRPSPCRRASSAHTSTMLTGGTGDWREFLKANMSIGQRWVQFSTEGGRNSSSPSSEPRTTPTQDDGRAGRVTLELAMTATTTVSTLKSLDAERVGVPAARARGWFSADAR